MLPFLLAHWHAVVFWLVLFWVYWPEMAIVRTAQKAAKRTDTKDAGSLYVITLGGGILFLGAIPLALVQRFQFPATWTLGVFVASLLLLIAGSQLRRHCWRMLGASFTGDVRAEAGQRIVTTGAYRWLRHPSYTAALMMTVAMGLALGSWASTTVLLVGSLVVYGYRIAVEERALVGVLGEPYREFMRTRRRLIPYVY